MKYSVYLPGLTAGCEQMERLARKQKGAVEELNQLCRELSRQSGMDDVLVRLKRELNNMERQLWESIRLAQALNRIYNTYLEMEHSIVDEASSIKGLSWAASHQTPVTRVDFSSYSISEQLDLNLKLSS